MKRLVAACLVAIAASATVAARADAHQPGQTLLVASYTGNATDRALHISADITLDEFDAAYTTTLANDPAASIAARHVDLASMIVARVTISDTAGHAWPITVSAVHPSTVDGYTTLHADIVANPPSGTITTPGALELRWAVITDVLYSHKVFVTGVDTTGTTNLIGTITHYQPTTTLVLDAAAPVVPTSLLRVGFEHFRAGADHLAFVCLLAIGAARRTTRRRTTLAHVLALSVAFTTGHSISLALAASGIVAVPSRVVETAIALTIVAAAVQTVRPLLHGRAELATTAAFGLIHGFGFAGVLAAVSLHGWSLLQPVLTFNIGLEAGQLLALATLLYPVARLRRTAHALSLVAAALGVTGLSWLLERATGRSNPFATLLAPALASPERLAALLLAASVVVALRRRRPVSAAANPDASIAGLSHR